MAVISFTGFVDDWTKDNPAHPGWGMKVSESHRKKDGDKWITVSRTRWTVKAAWEVNIDFTQFKSGDMVTIEGQQVTEVSERDGKSYSNLVVKANTVKVVAHTAPGAKPVEDDIF
jgi:hypothetical protein